MTQARDLGDAAARNAADAERQVKRDRAGGDEVNLLSLRGPELHDRAATELLLDRENGRINGLPAFRDAPLCSALFRHGHGSVTLLSLPTPRGADGHPRDGSAFFPVLVRGPRLPRLPIQLDVGRRLGKRLQLRLTGFLFRLLLGFAAWAISRAHRGFLRAVSRLSTRSSRRLHRHFIAT